MHSLYPVVSDIHVAEHVLWTHNDRVSINKVQVGQVNCPVGKFCDSFVPNYLLSSYTSTLTAPIVNKFLSSGLFGMILSWLLYIGNKYHLEEGLLDMVVTTIDAEQKVSRAPNLLLFIVCVSVCVCVCVCVCVV